MHEPLFLHINNTYAVELFIRNGIARLEVIDHRVRNVVTACGITCLTLCKRRKAVTAVRKETLGGNVVECRVLNRFLRGAVITVWADLFRQRQGELWFIEEEIYDGESSKPWHLQATTQHGWWQSQWQLWTQGENRKMVCPLTGGDSSHAQTLSLTTSRHFIHWINTQTYFNHSAKLSAGRVTQILRSLALDYNDKITDF